jgi:hypothetical protein
LLTEFILEDFDLGVFDLPVVAQSQRDSLFQRQRLPIGNGGLLTLSDARAEEQDQQRD